MRSTETTLVIVSTRPSSDIFSMTKVFMEKALKQL